MPNKRFLGLGFTFTATDKGLEKKLSSVSSLLETINSELTSVNKGFKSFGAGVGKVSNPGRKKASQAARPSRSQKMGPARRPSGTRPSPMARTFAPAQQQHSMGSSFGDLEDKLSKGSIDFVQGLSKASKTTIDQLKDNLSKTTGLFTDEFGNLTEDSQKALRKSALAFASDANSNVKSFEKTQKALAVVVGKTMDYLTEVKDSFGNFLGTLGLHLNEIIPPQFMAFGKLLKAVIAGPITGVFKGAKALAMKPFIKRDKESSASIDKQLKGVKVFPDISKKLGRNTKNDNLYSKTSELVDIEKDKKKDEKGGLLSSLGGLLKKLLFSPFTLLAGAASLLMKGFSALFSPLQTLTKLWGLVGEGMSGFWNILTKVGKPFLEIGAEIAVFGAALYGLFSGLVAGKQDWQDLIKGISDFASAVGGFIKGFIGNADSFIASFLAVHPVIDAFVQGIKGLADFILAVPMKLLGMIADGWKLIGKDIISGGAGMLGRFLSSSAQSITAATPVPAKPVDPTQAVNTNKVQDLRDGLNMQRQTDQAKNADTQISLMQDNNGLLNQLLNTMSKSPPGGAPPAVNVMINSDARKQGFALQKQELDMHGMSAQ